jgi:SH3 domain-containing YSC84-like protein 1
LRLTLTAKGLAALSGHGIVTETIRTPARIEPEETTMKLTHVALLLATSTLLHAAGDAAKRLNDSADMLSEIMSAPDKGIPQDLLDKAQCVVLVPGLKKGAFLVGAKYGKGFMLCRKASGVGWSAPAAIRVEGGSFGFQIGGSETDVVMLVNSDAGAKKLMQSKFTLGADASVAGGPVGRTSTAETDAQLHAEILTYSRSRGVFAGLSLGGATLRPDDDWNTELYGKPLTNQEIVMGNTPSPAAAHKLRMVLDKYSSRK